MYVVCYGCEEACVVLCVVVAERRVLAAHVNIMAVTGMAYDRPRTCDCRNSYLLVVFNIIAPVGRYK